MSSLVDITASSLIAAGNRPIYAGDDYDYTFAVTLGGAVYDLTGAKVWLAIKTAVLKPDREALLLYDSTDATEIELTNPALGVFVVHFKGTDTLSLAGRWQYDIKVREAGGKVLHIARGLIEILTTVTRALT